MGSTDRQPYQFQKITDVPRLRDEPFTPDAEDDRRCAFVKHKWHSQDELLRRRDRQIEENVRMLLGQQWIVWSDMRGKYIDLSETLKDDERRWRHMPVMNRLFLWYVLMHARMTENPPVISWQAGPDRIDSQLAEVMDTVFKHVWTDVGMTEVLDRMFAWMIPSGRTFLKSRIDLTKGAPIKAEGPAELELLNSMGSPILGADGNPIRRRIEESVPHGPDGEPLGKLIDGQGFVPQEGAEAHIYTEGGIAVDVLTALEARGEWGPSPWHHKGWHCHRSLLTPEQFWEAYGVEVEPDIKGQQAEDVGVVWRLLHSTGLFGAADGKAGGEGMDGASSFVSVYEYWQRPGRFPGTERTDSSPGGRLLTVTGGNHVVRDGVRTAAFEFTSPIRCFDFVNLPGRSSGSSPQEQMNGPQRTRNRMHAQIFMHATRAANPTKVVDRGSGIQEGQLSNIPGEEVMVDRKGSTVMPIEYVATPSLGREVFDAADRLAHETDQLGSIAGTEGASPTEDASGELVKELRYNADRPIASPMRRAVFELARMGLDWKVMLPTVWDQEKIIAITGEDHIARTVAVWPELFEKGTVNASPAIESMLPEGRGERQQRVRMMYADGIYGMPGTPQAIHAYLEQARFPHMSQAHRPGGVDRTTAAQNVGKLLQGTPASEIPVFPWYDFQIHIWVVEQFMKSPEYLKVDPAQQQEFVVHRLILKEAQLQAAVEEMGQSLTLEAATASIQQGMTGAPAGGDPNKPAPGPGPDGQRRESVPLEETA